MCKIQKVREAKIRQRERELEANMLKAEIRERLARLELLEYQEYQDTCFLDEFREEIRKYEL
jgi:hypothetical protein